MTSILSATDLERIASKGGDALHTIRTSLILGSVTPEDPLLAWAVVHGNGNYKALLEKARELSDFVGSTNTSRSPIPDMLLVAKVWKGGEAEFYLKMWAADYPVVGMLSANVSSSPGTTQYELMIRLSPEKQVGMQTVMWAGREKNERNEKTSALPYLHPGAVGRVVSVGNSMYYADLTGAGIREEVVLNGYGPRNLALESVHIVRGIGAVTSFMHTIAHKYDHLLPK
ncbi:hypothetical protein HZB01_00735 [Candidatus Woesearchaeota archaeon]|nr:hypothetical protein [Candidatus Woesearchaeota archaeon]